MAITECAGADSLVIGFLNRAKAYVHALTFLRNLFENFFIFRVVCSTPNDQRYGNGIGYFFCYFRSCIRIPVHSVGVCTFELKDDNVRSIILNTFLGPCLG